MKKTKIVIPALGLLLLSTAASVSGTVAWFSANTSVTVSGMNVTTQVSGNLLIAESNSSDDNYKAGPLSQTQTGILQPVSTVNGTSFFYTKNYIDGNGKATAQTGAFEPYTTDSALATYYDVVGAKGYVDYTFYLKATSSAASQKVSISVCNLKYNGTIIDGSDAETKDLAWRVAVFSQPVAVNTNSDTVGTNASILKLANATYFDGNAVSAATPTYAAPSNLGSEAVIGTLATAGLTQRYKVIVRLWLEGNDTSCTNETYATLTEHYTLDLTCALGVAGVLKIN